MTGQHKMEAVLRYWSAALKEVHCRFHIICSRIFCLSQAPLSVSSVRPSPFSYLRDKRSDDPTPPPPSLQRRFSLLVFFVAFDIEKVLSLNHIDITLIIILLSYELYSVFHICFLTTA